MRLRSCAGATVALVFATETAAELPTPNQRRVLVQETSAWSEEQTLLAADAGPFASFGYGVSVSGDTAVVGAPGADAAYVFVRSGTVWTQQQKLVAPGGLGRSRCFGCSVSVSGNTVIIGAQNDETPAGQSAGSAYVFVRSGTVWTQQQRILASDGASLDNFGSSVSVSGETAFVGAYLQGGSSAGAAYVFVRSGTVWSQRQSFYGAAGDQLGLSVSIAGDTAVVGSRGRDTTAGVNAGSAHVLVRSGTVWSQQQELVPSDAAANDQFGVSVSVSGDTAAIGSVTQTSGDLGSAYVFVRSGTVWSEQQKIVASDGVGGDEFGWSVAVSADRAVVGAYLDDTPGGVDAGSAYVFARSGTVWSEQQKLAATDGAAGDRYAQSVAVAGDTAVVGASRDDTAAGANTGSAHVFRDLPPADLSVSKTDGVASAAPGGSVTYTITASNAGPSPVSGAGVTDNFPAPLTCTTTCSGTGGATCTPGPFPGNISDSANIPVGQSVTYRSVCTVSFSATGSLINTATVMPPLGVTDPNPTNNSAADLDALIPQTDLSCTKTDSADPVSPGDPLTYVVTLTNAGPSHATGVTVVDALPTGVAFVSSSPGPPVCALAGATLTCDLDTLAATTTTAVTINVAVDGSAIGILVNTATVSGNETDPDPRNNSASAATAIGRRSGELAHGADAVYDLVAVGPVANDDLFRIKQKPYSSYEVVVDGTSGDIGTGAGPLLERIAADGTTVVQPSSSIGTGPSRSLRWSNPTSVEVEGETIRVRSGDCSTDCGPEDLYRIRAYETTYSVPRFNNTGTQVTVLVVQNPTSYPVSGEIYFRNPSGLLVAVAPLGLGPKQTLVLHTAAVPGAAGASGTITIAHDGRYGDLTGKAVALEAATGFSFDAALVPRPR